MRYVTLFFVLFSVFASPSFAQINESWVRGKVSEIEKEIDKKGNQAIISPHFQFYAPKGATRLTEENSLALPSVLPEFYPVSITKMTEHPQKKGVIGVLVDLGSNYSGLLILDQNTNTVLVFSTHNKNIPNRPELGDFWIE